MDSLREEEGDNRVVKKHGEIKHITEQIKCKTR
jgi:hypothetical protein